MGEVKVIPQQNVETTLFHAFEYFFHLDHSNAAFHCSTVRFSPITFRLAEHLWQNTDWHVNEHLREIILDIGQYEEDRGR
jgi:hypothetical protein